MIVTGYQLKTAIQRWELRRDAAAAQFAGSLAKFEDQEIETPQAITDKFLKAERAICVLQTFQGRYNLEVQISVQGNAMSLAEGVKQVGGLGRIEKMWRAAAMPAPRSSWDTSNNDGARSKDNVYKKPTVTTAEIVAKAEELSRIKGALTQAIAEANATKINVGNLESGLLD